MAILPSFHMAIYELVTQLLTQC